MRSNYRRTIGEVLEDLMKERNLTGTALAKKANLSASTISDMINDTGREVRYTAIISLARALDVSSDYLLGLSDFQSTDPTMKNAKDALFGITEKAFNTLYYLYNCDEDKLNGMNTNIAIDDMNFFLEQESDGLMIMGLIREYLFADFSRLYYYHSKEDIRKNNAFCISTDDLHLPLECSQLSEGDFSSQYSYNLSEEHFSLMLLQIIMDRIKDWRKRIQEEISKEKEADK